MSLVDIRSYLDGGAVGDGVDEEMRIILDEGVKAAKSHLLHGLVLCGKFGLPGRDRDGEQVSLVLEGKGSDKKVKLVRPNGREFILDDPLWAEAMNRAWEREG